MCESERARVHAVLGRVKANSHANGRAREKRACMGISGGREDCMHDGEHRKHNIINYGVGGGGMHYPAGLLKGKVFPTVRPARRVPAPPRSPGVARAPVAWRRAVPPSCGRGKGVFVSALY